MNFKYISTVLVSSLGLLFTGCSDFLEEDPSSIGTAETYFPTASGFDGALNACYSSLRSLHNNRNLWLWGTDQFMQTNGYPTEKAPGTYTNLDVYSNQSLNSENGTIKSLWENAYIGIDRCNRVIQLSETAQVPETERTVKVAEAISLRALYYYYLVEQFGAIPFPLKPYETLQTEGDRVAEDVIYKQLISDLETAQTALPNTSPQFGRVTKGMAQMLLAKLYLTRGYRSYTQNGDFENAAKYADMIINSGTYNLLDNFAMVFLPGNEKNAEIIFSVQWTKDRVLNKWDWADSGYGNNYHSKFGIAYDNFIGGQRSNYYNRSIRIYNETFHTIECFGVDTLKHPGESYQVPDLLYPLEVFPENQSYKIDKRFDATFKRLTMVEVSTLAARKYGPDQTTKWQVWSAGEGSGTNNLVYAPTQVNINENYWLGTGRDTSMYIPAPDESHLWPAERFMNVPYGVVPYQLWFKDANSKEKKLFEKAYGTVPNSLWFHIDWLQARPYIYKFREPESFYSDNDGVRDLFLMRLGEVYLIAAEAYYKSGNTNLAAERINTIRRRACGGEDYMQIKASDVDLDFILDERTRELVGEELRWVELKRTGKLKERTLKYNYWAASPFIPGGKPYMEDFHMLRPIPYSWWSLLSNKESVKQNPGYE